MKITKAMVVVALLFGVTQALAKGTVLTREGYEIYEQRLDSSKVRIRFPIVHNPQIHMIRAIEPDADYYKLGCRWLVQFERCNATFCMGTRGEMIAIAYEQGCKP
jgi:hypothetical protein